MIYQAFLCISQTAIVMAVLRFYDVAFPDVSYVTGNAAADLFITLFLSTYAADMLAAQLSRSPTLPFQNGRFARCVRKADIIRCPTVLY